MLAAAATVLEVTAPVTELATTTAADTVALLLPWLLYRTEGPAPLNGSGVTTTAPPYALIWLSRTLSVRPVGAFPPHDPPLILTYAPATVDQVSADAMRETRCPLLVGNEASR